MTKLLSLTLIALCCAGMLPSCALLSKSEPFVPRYFTPQSELAASTSASSSRASSAEGSALQLRLGRVSSSDHLRERIAFRSSPEELGYYDDLRWTERPEEFMRRELSSALFEEHGYARIASGGGATLEVELTAFEELQKPEHAARVQAVILLHDGRFVRLEQTVTSEVAIGQNDKTPAPQNMVQALSRALHDCVEQIVARVEPLVAASAASAASPQPMAAEPSAAAP